MEPTKEPTVVINETMYPDSQEFGTCSKGGTHKVYYNASHMDEAKERIANALELFRIGKEGFEKIVKTA